MAFNIKSTMESIMSPFYSQAQELSICILWLSFVHIHLLFHMVVSGN